MELSGVEVEHTAGFLADRLEIRRGREKTHQAFFIDRLFSRAGKAAVERLRDDAKLAGGVA